jgi:hypothetical protein
MRLSNRPCILGEALYSIYLAISGYVEECPGLLEKQGIGLGFADPIQSVVRTEAAGRNL